MTRPLMIFAAGLGRRMAPLSDHRPKPLVEVAGRALIDHALRLAVEAQAEPVVVNIHAHADQMRRYLADRDVRIADETARLLETGSGLRAARPLLGPGPVLTLNSDTVWTGANPLSRLLAAWDPTRMDALLIVVPPEQATGHVGGDFALTPDGRLTRGGRWVYGGAQMLDPAGLDAIPDEVFSLNRLWDRAASRGRLYGLEHEGGWCDVGTPASIPLAEALLA